MKSNLNHIFCLIIFTLFVSLSAWGDVPKPPAPPAPPAGYCSTIYNELKGYLDNFNQTLGNPAPYPTLQFAQLQMADSNVGPGLSGPNYLSSVLVQAQQLKAMGFDGVKVQVAFPVLYEPFFGSRSAMQPYLNFYQQLAENIHAMGMKLLVENNVLLSTGTEVGWTNVAAYYATLSWDQFIAGRAAMAGTIAQYLQPDFLMLSQEPDNEAANARQPNLKNPTLAAAMIAAQITSARLVSLKMKLGAGIGTWMGPYSPNGLLDFVNAYVLLPLDYFDMHIYPINTEYNGLSNFLANALLIANTAAAALKPVAISESWPWKMEDAEFNKVSPDTFRARNPFTFWGPIDTYFIRTMEKLAKYTRMLYLTSQGNEYFLAYQNYGGSAANGGAQNCTCTTASCSDAEINAQENSLADSAGKLSQYTTTGLDYSSLLIDPADTLPPSQPAKLTGTAAYNSATLAWSAASDNVGVAGYNIYRCSPPPCTGTWIANSAPASFVDTGLDDNTPYQYQVQAFDIANNTSPASHSIVLTTALNTPPGAPTNTAATAVSPSEIDLTWSPPQNSAGLSKYVIYRGPARSNLVQVGTMPPTSTIYHDRSVNPSATYFYGIEAVEQGLTSPMSAVAYATSLPLPNSPAQLSATAQSSTKIALSWQETLPARGLPIANYQIYQGTSPDKLTKVATVNTTACNRYSLTPGVTYYFQVVAVDTSHSSSAPSREVAAATLP